VKTKTLSFIHTTKARTFLPSRDDKKEKVRATEEAMLCFGLLPSFCPSEWSNLQPIIGGSTQ
jgi:hypothetical protein